MNAPVKVPTHIVVEVFERDVGAKKLCYSKEEAIEAANEMLEEHIKSIGRFCDYETGEDEWDYYVRASRSCSNPWCNYGDMNWDAYIIELEED